MSEAYTLHTVKFTVCLQYSLQYSLQYARLRVQLQNGMHYVREVVRMDDFRGQIRKTLYALLV